jgi:protein TonB
MLGLSDTTVGALVSVVLHAGVAVAFLGPLGEGAGAGSTVVMVSIDGIEVPESRGEDLQRGEPQPILPSVPQDAQGAFRTRQEPPRTANARAMPLKRQRAPLPPPIAQPTEPQTGDSGGGGLLQALYSQPVMTFMPKPLYPRSARQRGVEGKVSVKVWVTAEGTVERAEVVKGSGSELLDRAAHESALEARFKPALKAGVPTGAEKTMVITFSLIE